MAALPTSLPFDDPILVFALAVICFLVAPIVMERYRLPGIVGIILAGALVGPNAVGLLDRGETIVLLGNVGVVYLMFLVGLEINLAEFRENRDQSIGFGVLSFVIPQAVGTVVGVHLLGFSLLTALLFASVFASHTLLAYPVINRLGIGDNRAVTAAIGGTILTDTLALLVLAVVAAATHGDLTVAFWIRLAAGLVAFFVGTWVLVPRIGRWFFRTVHQESYFEYLFVIAIAFVAAYAGELAGIDAIIGAFVAGLAINPLVPNHGVLMNRIEFVGNALFIPFFLLSVGMLVDFTLVFGSAATLVLTGALVAMTVTTKLGAAAVAGWRYGYTPAEVGSMFGLSVGQAAAALAVTLVGFELDLFDDTVVNAVILMILAISILAPLVTDRYGRDVALARERSPEPSDAPQRILIPFSSDSRYREQLLAMAIILRRPESSEPIYVVTIVRPDDPSNTDAAVADAERHLEESASYAAGAEVPIELGTRVTHNVASGIASAATENRASTVLIGWDGADSRTQSVFGNTIDRVIRQTGQQIVVARVRSPLNVTNRLVLVCPPDIDHNDGFREAIRSVKTVAGELGAELHVYPVGEDPTRYRTSVEDVDPETPVVVHETADWDRIYELLGDLEPNTFVVALSTRRGRLGWHAELRTLPTRIATEVPGNFAILYVRADRVDDERRFFEL